MTIDERERRKEAKAIRSLNRKDEHEELADDALKALTQVIILLVGIIIGFQIGVQKAHAAVLTKGHLSATWMPGAEIVEPVPEIPPEDGRPPEAIEAPWHLANVGNISTPSDPEPEWVSLGVWKLTAYCPWECCNGKGRAWKTSSGKPMKAGWTVATYGLPAGTQVMINGHVYCVEDTGVYGHHIDILYPDHQSASDFGIRHAEVFIRKERY